MNCRSTLAEPSVALWMGYPRTILTRQASDQFEHTFGNAPRSLRRPDSTRTRFRQYEVSQEEKSPTQLTMMGFNVWGHVSPAPSHQPSFSQHSFLQTGLSTLRGSTPAQLVACAVSASSSHEYVVRVTKQPCLHRAGDHRSVFSCRGTPRRILESGDGPSRHYAV